LTEFLAATVRPGLNDSFAAEDRPVFAESFAAGLLLLTVLLTPVVRSFLSASLTSAGRPAAIGFLLGLTLFTGRSFCGLAMLTTMQRSISQVPSNVSTTSFRSAEASIRT
jgi:hypothetical protein